MKKQFAVLSLIVTIIVAYSCKKQTSNNLSGEVTLDLPSKTDAYFSASGSAHFNDSLNKVATLGRVLFYDGHLSLNNAISCGSCHKQVYGFADNSRFSLGYEGRLTGRNSPGISSVNSFGPLFWDGREQNLKNLIMRPVTNHVEMGIDDATALPAKLSKLPYYNQLFTNAFGDQSVTVERVSLAVTTFIQALGNKSQLSSKTRFEQYQSGLLSAMTAEEINGMNLFDNKYNCRSCHGGNSGGYSGIQDFKDIGLDGNYSDPGRSAITGRDADKGKFKVPDLRNVALTAPYMHDGRFKTLDEVLEHYSHNINNSPNLDTVLKDNYGKAKSFNITQSDKKAIIAFLNTLTDYGSITDQKFSNPFKIR